MVSICPILRLDDALVVSSKQHRLSSLLSSRPSRRLPPVSFALPEKECQFLLGLRLRAKSFRDD